MEPIDNDRWERLAPRLEVPEDQVAALLAAALPGFELAAVVPEPGGLANTNLRCEARDATPVLLRLHQRDPAAAAKERALLARVAGHVPVARVLAHGDDGPGGLPWTLQEYAQGVLLARLLEAGDPQVCAAAGRACGAALVSLRGLGFERSGELGSDLQVTTPFHEDEPFGAGYLAILLADEGLQEILGPARRAKVEAFAAEAPQRLPPPDGTLCHADFKGSNLVLTPDGAEVVALLDWEFAFAGTRLFDLAALSRWEPLLEPSFLAGVEEGVAAGGDPLPATWRRTARDLDVLNLLSMLHGAPAGTRRRADLLGLLDRNLAGV